jgi:hypothetical protein
MHVARGDGDRVSHIILRAPFAKDRLAPVATATVRASRL